LAIPQAKNRLYPLRQQALFVTGLIMMSLPLDGWSNPVPIEVGACE